MYKTCHANPVIDVLKFEYFTQLLLDSNYLPLILKMFLHQDVDQSVAQDIDKEELRYVFGLMKCPP